MTELWIAYIYDPMPIVSAVFVDELEARRFAADQYASVAKIKPGIEIREQVK